MAEELINIANAQFIRYDGECSNDKLVEYEQLKVKVNPLTGVLAFAKELCTKDDARKKKRFIWLLMDPVVAF